MWRLVCILALLQSLNAGSETPRQVVAVDINGIVHPITVVMTAHTLHQGAMLLIDSPFPEMRIRLSVALGVALPFALIVLLLTTVVVRARRAPVATGREGMIGEKGIAVGPLSPTGKVFVHGEYWDAVAVSAIPDGAPVRVTAVERLTLRVQPSSEKPGG